MVRIQKVILAFLLAGVAAVATPETVYKWVDSSGQVHYTDLPPQQSGARILSVNQQESDLPDDGGSDNGDFSEEGDSDTLRSPQPGETTTPEPPVSDQAMAAAEADAAKAKVLQCKTAQDRYERYVNSRRLFRETADGKREYLTDKELTEARARAQEAVSDYCS